MIRLTLRRGMLPCAVILRAIAAGWFIFQFALFFAPSASALPPQTRQSNEVSQIVAEGRPAPSGVVTLRQALAATLVRSPDLRAFSAEVRAREALALQAGLRPNPELRIEIEDVGGSGTRKGFEDSQTTVRLSQLVELGGKRFHRHRAAELNQELAGWDYAAKRLAILSATTRVFITTLAAQERRALAIELERLARDTLSAVERGVSAGASSPVETTRARVALGRAEIERSRAERELRTARALLAATWGGQAESFDRVEGDLTALDAPPSEKRLLGTLGATPDLARWKTEHEERETSLALEKARRIPDVTVDAGGRYFTDNGDAALVVELSVPLPVFDRNQGAIAAARHRLAKAHDEAATAEVGARSAVVEAYERLLSAHEQATALKSHVLPDAQASSAGALDAFRQGLLRPVDVLDAQRTLFELRGEYLRALEAFHLAAADIERLTGTSLRELAQGERP